MIKYFEFKKKYQNLIIMLNYSLEKKKLDHLFLYWILNKIFPKDLIKEEILIMWENMNGRKRIFINPPDTSTWPYIPEIIKTKGLWCRIYWNGAGHHLNLPIGSYTPCLISTNKVKKLNFI